MTKEKQMIEYMIQDLVEIIVDVQKVEYDDAMAMLYASLIYDKISDIETGLYRESPAYVYGLFQDEMNFGKIVQAELQSYEKGLVCWFHIKNAISFKYATIVSLISSGVSFISLAIHFVIIFQMEPILKARMQDTFRVLYFW